jgi:proteasome lid subunit RPN8/RPN11
MDEIEINILNEGDDLPYGTPPLRPGNHIVWGVPDQADVYVLCNQQVIQKTEAYSRSSKNEVGGILVGKSYRNEGRIYTHVIDFIPAPVQAHGQSGRGHFNFTPETWAAMNREKDKKFDHLSIVGWFHSHPGHGIFLSKGFDVEIQYGHFNRSWLIAMVYDPIRHEGGFFTWQQRKTIDAPGFIEFFQPDNNQSIITWRNWPHKEAKPDQPTPIPSPTPNLSWLYAGITILFLLLIFYVLYDKTRFDGYSRGIDSIISSNDERLVGLDNTTTAIQNEIKNIQATNQANQHLISTLEHNLQALSQAHTPTITNTPTPTYTRPIPTATSTPSITPTYVSPTPTITSVEGTNFTGTPTIEAGTATSTPIVTYPPYVIPISSRTVSEQFITPRK